MRLFTLMAVTGGILLLACGGGGDQDPSAGTVDTSKASGGTGGSRRTGGTTGASMGGSGGTGGSVTPTTGSGGSPGGGDVGPADAAAPGGDAAGDDDAAEGSGGAPLATDAGPLGDGAAAGGPALGFYEAEAIMPAGPNQLLPPAIVGGCGATNPVCGAPATIAPEAMCCSHGMEVRQLLRGRGGLVFNKISAPADGMYDVTWWYHCGLNDNFGDPNCGGEPNRPKAGCRPHILTVNGMQQPKVFEFHCFPGPWGQIHAVTTPLPLKAGGDNSIKVVATTGRDAADLDAIAIYPAGKGVPPVAFAH